jgi:eukaryotic-like serine/threonine-protein kinase
VIANAIPERAPTAPVRLNPDLPTRFEEVINKALEKDRKLRYQSAAEIRSDLQRLKRDSGSSRIVAATAHGEPRGAARSTRLRWAAAAATVVVIGLGLGGWLFFSRNAHALTDKDTIVLADFTNTTGDTVFDSTLRQGLSVQLEQSPFLSIISDQRVQQTLQMMERKPDAKLTPEIARELCQRTSSAAVLDGSIAQIGTQYLLTVKAVNCSSGETLASTESEASDKNHVLEALGKTASEIRNKLGESLSTVRKLDTPLEQATTPSLEALQAYSLANKAFGSGEYGAVVPLLRATRLDPNFGMAYAFLGDDYANLGETSLAGENYQKAYAMRDRVSERERLYIESNYHQNITGDLEKAREVYELWARAYSRDSVPRVNLGFINYNLGQYDKALVEIRESFRLDPDAFGYDNLVGAYLNLNRLQEAQATAEEARAKKMDSPDLHLGLYQIAFLQGVAAGMEEQVRWGAGNPGVENVLLAAEADTSAFSGQLREARELSRRAMDSAKQSGEKEPAATYFVLSGLREGLFGNTDEARRRATLAMEHMASRHLQYGIALALAYARDKQRAQPLVDDLGKRFPEDTLVQLNYLPTLRAKLAVSRGNPSEAIEILKAAMPYELGTSTAAAYGWWNALYPIYVRGEAFLAAHQGSKAAAEFQKILDHRGVVANQPIGAIAHLQIGRAYVTQGDTAKAKAAYQDFLTLWKDADPDIPILKQAKAEYARLR